MNENDLRKKILSAREKINSLRNSGKKPGRAEVFLTTHMRYIRNKHELMNRTVETPIPYIESLDHDDVSLHWNTEKFEMLITVPSNPEKAISFYWDDKGKKYIKGILDLSSVCSEIIECLLTKV